VKVLGKCQLREVVEEKEEGLDSSGTHLSFVETTLQKSSLA